MRKKRRPRGYRNLQRKGVKPNFTPVILILCLSIGCGYATAKYVVDPVVNYVPQLTAESGQTQQETETTNKKEQETQATVKKNDVVEDDVKVEEKGKISGYALQFGCYSSKGAAENAMSSLGITGLKVLEQNDMYKIVGEIFDTKEEAQEALKSLSDPDKAFVTTIYE